MSSYNYNIEKDKDITSLTTFGIPVKARFFAEYSSEKELLAISRSEKYLENEVLHIGGGSNLLFLSDFNGLVLHSAIKGFSEYRKDDETVYAIVGAGEKWTDFVEWCLARGYAGAENLAYIPGEVGASAIQNVGAYGAEACDIIHTVKCFDTISRKTVVFKNEECRFGYRDSIFKNEAKGRYYVLQVAFKLRLDGVARNLSYGPLQALEERLGRRPTIREVAEEVTAIRKSKLPEPTELGSAGSFFKNPVVSGRLYRSLKQEWPDCHGYEVKSCEDSDNSEDCENPENHEICEDIENKSYKLSAAWLIDRAGLKGAVKGGAAIYDKQPLVIVNQGYATAADVKNLADMIIKGVRTKFYVTLKPEVNYIDTDMRITMLGSGTSKGVPEVGCECRVCTSDDPHDKRLRASVMVETAGLRILIDPSADFREQMLRHRPADIDAVLVTHGHYDHVGGFDDLRPFCGNDKLPVYLREDVDRDLRRRLDYCFREHPYPGVPVFDMHVIGDRDFFIKGLRIRPIEVLHGKLPIFGYRIGRFAYVTDAKTIEPSEMEKLDGLSVLVLNALRDKPHFAHLSISEALDIVEEMKPEYTFFTHFNHEAGLTRELMERLPEGVYPGVDGLEINIHSWGEKTGVSIKMP